MGIMVFLNPKHSKRMQFWLLLASKFHYVQLSLWIFGLHSSYHNVSTWLKTELSWYV